MVLETFFVLILVLIIPALMLAIILLLASLDIYFTKIPQGATIFITAGEKLKVILPNAGKFMMSNEEDLDGRHWLIPAEDDEDKHGNVIEGSGEKKRDQAFFRNCLPGTRWFHKLLWERTGVRWISILHPHTHRHTFDIRSRKRLLESAGTAENMSLKKRVVDSTKDDGNTKESTIVDSLLFLVPRPMYLEGVVLAGDNSKINLLLLPQFRQIIPALPVYYLRGDFFTLLEGAIEAGVSDFFSTYRVKENENDPNDKGKPLTYDSWLKLQKAGEGSPLERHLYQFNANKTYYEELNEAGKKSLVKYLDRIPHGELVKTYGDKVEKSIPSGMIRRFGFYLSSFRIVAWEPHDDTKKLAEAILTMETERHTAEGVRQKAAGERDAIFKVAEGEANRSEQLVTALIKKGVTPDVAARVVETQFRMEQIHNSGLGVYVEGGASTPTSVMVPAPPTKSQT